jgi:hypothetical protein
MKKSRKLFILTFLFYFSALSLPVAAEPTKTLTPEEQAESDALIKQAVEYYRAREYDEAIVLFEKAYELIGEPELLYNIARSHERLGNSEEAVTWYERFLEVPGTTGALRARALTNIATLRRELAAEKAVQESEKAAAEAAASSETNPSGSTTGSDANANGDSDTTDVPMLGNSLTPDQTMPTPPPAKHKTSSLRIASFAMIGVGLAAMITGGVFGGLSIGAKNDFEASGYEPDRVQYRKDMERDALIFDIVFTTGSVILATGVSLFVADAVRSSADKETYAERGHPKKEDTLTVIPSLVVRKSGMTGGLAVRF